MEKEYIEYEGTVIFLPSNLGTKSEGIFPFLYVNKESIIKIIKENDNPFENKGLLEFDGKKVKITGYKGRSALVVTEVKINSESEGEKSNDLS